MQIGLLGHGVVGSGVSKLIDESLSNNAIQIKKILVKDINSLQDTRATIDINEILNDSEIDTIVECIGGLEPAHTYVKYALEKHKNVVTSNKKMFATYAKELLELASKNQVSFCYEASVAGGIPWIHECNRISRIDPIQSFVGIMNGTTNYILYNMEKHSLSFEEALKSAQEKGYAEKDPTDDICGYDTCFKTSLTALTAFHTFVDPKSIPTFGIQNIRREDFSYAKSINSTIKLLSKGYYTDTPCLYVIPTFVSNDSLISHVSDNYNYVSTHSFSLGNASFIGQGAGSLPTANAILQDLFDILEKKTYSSYSENKKNKLSPVYGNFYIHTNKLGLDDSLIQTKLDDHTFITKKVSLSNLKPFILGHEDLFIAEVEE